MTQRLLLSGFLALALFPLAAPPIQAQDHCLLTLTEARELGGSGISQAAGDARGCSYVTSDGAARLVLEITDAAATEAQAKIEELGDAARFTARQKGKITYWLSREDELVGWVRRGDRLAALRAEDEVNAKRRRLLEHALQRVGARLR